MTEPVPTELVVRQVGGVQTSPMGHRYVEARVDGGVVAFWGSADEMSHIDEVRSLSTPFRIICDCIKSNWHQHDLWVHERHQIYAVEVEPATALGVAEPPGPSRGRVVQLSCRRCGHLRELDDNEFRNLVTTYGVDANRTIPTDALQRLRCQQCGARDVRQRVKDSLPPVRRMTREVSGFRTCSACSGDGGPDGRCWKCWGRGFIDVTDNE